MFQTRPLLTISADWQTATRQAIQALNLVGLQVVRSFDLRAARLAPLGLEAACECTHHGTARCDCQLLMLLVYAPGNAPATLVVHGHDEQTHFALVSSPQQRADPHLEQVIRTAFAQDGTQAGADGR